MTTKKKEPVYIGGGLGLAPGGLVSMRAPTTSFTGGGGGETTKIPEPEDDRAKIYKDPRTGRASGVDIGGRIFFGLGPDDVKKVVAQEAARRGVDVGQIDVKAVAQQEELTEELGARARIEELKEQVLTPGTELITAGETGVGGGGITTALAHDRLGELVGTSAGGGMGVGASTVQRIIHNQQKEVQSIIQTNVNKESSAIAQAAQTLFLQITSKGAKLAGGSVLDQRLQNMEQALVNHREGAGDIILALQSGAYDPYEAIDDSNNMVDDANVVEETMQLLARYAPSIWAEMKGWEFTTRLQKIRRGILTRQQQIINIATTGQAIPPEAGQLDLLLNDLTVKGGG